MDWHSIDLFARLGLGAGGIAAGLGLSVVLTYRGSGIINLAAGAVAMVAAYALWALTHGEFGFHLAEEPAAVLALVVAAALGVLLAAQAALVIAFGFSGKDEPELLPSTPVRFAGNTIPEYDYVLAGVALFTAAVLVALYRWTRFGLATRAASENEVSAMLVGLSPNRLSLANTVLSSLVA